jgi:hypothetical protein
MIFSRTARETRAHRRKTIPSALRLRRCALCLDYKVFLPTTLSVSDPQKFKIRFFIRRAAEEAADEFGRVFASAGFEDRFSVI